MRAGRGQPFPFWDRKFREIRTPRCFWLDANDEGCEDQPRSTEVMVKHRALLICGSGFFAILVLAQTPEKPRVFVTDSQSWSISGSSGGSSSGFGGHVSGDALK